MDWIGCSDRMDQFVIKKDGTAVDIDYFMATHVPFRDLEFIEYGDTEIKPVHLNEEQIYDGYIVNRANKHQMIIVRGTHGSGKSHLICWLHNRFVSDTVNYNPDKEKVVFLRRLRNTVRGAVQQMLDEDIVRDKELKEKFEKFTASTESQTEEEFKVTIYGEYARKSQTDSTGKVFKPKVCKDIAAFLLDTRVQNYMMRPDGPVDRCYQKITAGATSVVSEDTEKVFTEEDFVFPGDVARSIKKESAEEVKNYYLYELGKGEEKKKITQLVSYLNHFTSGVIQNCANITSENARDLFVNLRKSLHEEGKNLTIFIEDFTSFSIVESELITALSVENGGNYSDLCRVTSVIGITDGYYGDFRDNFKTRVTKQIRVTEQSFGGEEFLLEMAARYLNAIYCKTESVREWYKGNAVGDTLPDSGFTPGYEWDSVEIGGKSYTLYPFNHKSLLTFYNRLQVKTTRNFLTYAIQHSFQLFADGMEYKSDWAFPELPPYIDNVALPTPDANSIETSAFPDSDKQRMKVLFGIWGNGTTNSDDNTVGGISRMFLKDIGLEGFNGIRASGFSTGGNQEKKPEVGTDLEQSSGSTEKKPVKPKLSPKEKSFIKRKQDIESWFEEKKTLQMTSDYNLWVGDFVVQAIDWQDEGYPGDFVAKRKNDGNFVDIEDSKLATDRDTAIVVMDRNPESRTVLLGLTYFDYYKTWDFEDASYYQLVLINWLEKNKQTFIDRIFGKSVGKSEHPVVTWCLVIEYLQRLLYGENLKDISDADLLWTLIGRKADTTYKERINLDWNDTVKYLSNKSSMVEVAKNSLVAGSKTIMGIVGDTYSSGGKVSFYHTGELLDCIDRLKKKEWDISDELNQYDTPQYEKIRKHLAALYDKLGKVAESEKKLASDAVKAFEKMTGKNPTMEDYLSIISEIRSFFANCKIAHEPFSTKLEIQFDDEPQDQAKKAIERYKKVCLALKCTSNVDMIRSFSGGLLDRFREIIVALEEVEKLAKEKEEKNKKMIGTVDQVDPLMVEATLNTLSVLSEKLEGLEVAE